MHFLQKMFGWAVGKHDTDSCSSEDENNVTIVEQKPKRKTITEEDLMEIEVKRKNKSSMERTSARNFLPRYKKWLC